DPQSLDDRDNAELLAIVVDQTNLAGAWPVDDSRSTLRGAAVNANALASNRGNLTYLRDWVKRNNAAGRGERLAPPGSGVARENRHTLRLLPRKPGSRVLPPAREIAAPGVGGSSPTDPAAFSVGETT